MSEPEIDDLPKGRKSRRERFVRVATRRTKAALNDLQRLGKCANRSAYDYKDEDTAKIFNAIDAQLDAVKRLFKSKTERKEVDFSLD